MTVRTVEPLTSPNVALMLLVPAATPWARPVVLMVAIERSSPEAQLTEPVITAVELSEYVPVATNCWFAPATIDGLAGVTAMLCRVAEVTVRTVEPLMSPSVALMLDRADRHAVGQTSRADRRFGGGPGGPGHGAGQVQVRAVTVRAGGRELLGQPGRDRGIGRRDRDALQASPR